MKTSPAMTTSTWPAGQSSTPPVVPSGVVARAAAAAGAEEDLQGGHAQRRVGDAAHDACDAVLRAQSLASGPWPRAARIRRQAA